MRRELRVDRQLWTPRAGPPSLARPKSKNSYRTLARSRSPSKVWPPWPRAGRSDVPVPGPPPRRAQVGAHVRRTVARAGLERRTWHDHRHHHAGVLLSAGVSPALLAERLGHDVATLLKTYAHVIRADEDRVRSIVDGSLGGSAEDWLRTEASR
jgi:integrase